MGDPQGLRVLAVTEAARAALLEEHVRAAAPDGVSVAVERSASLPDAVRRVSERDRPPPDVVLVDLVGVAGGARPGGRATVAGVAVLTSIPGSPPVVAVTSGSAERARELVDAGAGDCLDPDELGESERLWRVLDLAVARHQRVRMLIDQGADIVRARSQLVHLSSRLRHDLRVPLAVAISALETMDEVELGEEARADLLTMVHGRLRDLVARLDDLGARLAEDPDDAGEDGPRREHVDVAAVVAEVRADLTPWERDRLQLEVAAGEPVWASRRLLRGLLGGLVRNALQHNPDRAVAVRVEVAVDEARAVVLVADDGVGIDPGVREAVFGLGWTTEEPSVPGIGLAAASSAVAIMQGTIRAVDSPLGGAAFRIELPQRPDADRGRGAAAAQRSQPDSNR